MARNQVPATGGAVAQLRDPVFGPLAPPKNLALPPGNITMYEQLVFLPNSLRNADVALRFANNGVVQEAVAEIFTRGRVLPKNTCSVNNALKMMQAGNRHLFGHKKGSGDNWTPKKAFQNERPDDWDSTDLSWSGCKLDTEHNINKGDVEDSIPFEELARDVRIMPTGYDALDLTRCVFHAVKHPGRYLFPRDFPALTEQLGGPSTVYHGHLDAAVAARYAPKSRIFKRRLREGLITESEDTPLFQDHSGLATNRSMSVNRGSNRDARSSSRLNEFFAFSDLCNDDRELSGNNATYNGAIHRVTNGDQPLLNPFSGALTPRRDCQVDTSAASGFEELTDYPALSDSYLETGTSGQLQQPLNTYPPPTTNSDFGGGFFDTQLAPDQKWPTEVRKPYLQNFITGQINSTGTSFGASTAFKSPFLPRHPQQPRTPDASCTGFQEPPPKPSKRKLPIEGGLNGDDRSKRFQSGYKRVLDSPQATRIHAAARHPTLRRQVKSGAQMSPSPSRLDGAAPQAFQQPEDYDIFGQVSHDFRRPFLVDSGARTLEEQDATISAFVRPTIIPDIDQAQQPDESLLPSLYSQEYFDCSL